MMILREIDPAQVPSSVRWAIARGTLVMNVRQAWKTRLDALKTNTRSKRENLSFWWMRQRAQLFVHLLLAHVIARQTGRRLYTWSSRSPVIPHPSNPANLRWSAYYGAMSEAAKAKGLRVERSCPDEHGTCAGLRQTIVIGWGPLAKPVPVAKPKPAGLGELAGDLG